MRSKDLMSRLSFIQNCLCPDFRAFQRKRNSCSPKLIISVFMSRLSCVQKTLCPDFLAFKTAHVQTIVRSKLPMIRRLSCAQSCIWPDYRAFKVFYDHTIVRSNLHTSRLSCVQNCICPDYIVRSFFSRPCNFKRKTPPGAFISVWTYRLSV